MELISGLGEIWTVDDNNVYLYYNNGGSVFPVGCLRMSGLINDKIYYHYHIVIRTQLNLDGSQLVRLNVNLDC